MLWVRGGADARDEAEGEDEEDAGYCADGTEYAGAFEAAEEATDDCAGQDGRTGDEVAGLDAKEAQRDDEESGKGAGQQADDGDSGGRARDFDGAADDEAEDGAKGCARNCATQGSEKEAAYEPYQALAGHDAHEAKASGEGGWDLAGGVQGSATFTGGYVKARGRGTPIGGWDGGPV